MNTINIQKHLSKLGYRCEDKVSGFKGVITSIGFDLYGCVQAVVNPGIDKDGKQGDLAWFDLNRLNITSDQPVMDPPNYEYGPQAEGEQGVAEKPAGMRG